MVFGDALYWIALIDPRDSKHRDALRVTARLQSSKIVTTDEVLVEVLTFFSGASAPMRREAAALVQDLLRHPGVLVVPQSRQSFIAGLRLYESRSDKGYSLVDCISMETMRREGLSEVLTNDRHFEQEGFRALFR